MKFLVLALVLVVSARGQPLSETSDVANKAEEKEQLPAEEISPSKSYVNHFGNIGTSGILRKDGSVDLFTHDFAHDIVMIGPSGIITRSGMNVQLTPDLRLVKNHPRTKRHVIGDSGMITSWGELIQFRKPNTRIYLEGPSAIMLTDGQVIQKPKEY